MHVPHCDVRFLIAMKWCNKEAYLGMKDELVETADCIS